MRRLGILDWVIFFSVVFLSTAINNLLSLFSFRYHALIALFVITCLVIYLLRWRDHWVGASLNIRAPIVNAVAGGVVASFSVLLALILMMLVLGLEVRFSPVYFTPTLSLALLVFYTFGAVYEELYYRFFFYRLTMNKSFFKIVVLSSVFFTITHVDTWFNLLGTTQIFTMGAVCMYLFLQTKSLVFVIGYHCLWNIVLAVFGFINNARGLALFSNEVLLSRMTACLVILLICQVAMALIVGRFYQRRILVAVENISAEPVDQGI